MQEKENSCSQVYELGFHILPTVEEERLSEKTAEIKLILTENGASVIAEGFPKSCQLAYAIREKSNGEKGLWNKSYFGYIKFEIPKENLAKLEKILKNNSQILRFIIIKIPKMNAIYQKPFSDSERNFFISGDSKETSEKISQEEIDKSIDELVDNNIL